MLLRRVPEHSRAPSTLTAGEPCPDLTHAEVPGMKGSTSECENTPCLCLAGVMC